MYIPLMASCAAGRFSYTYTQGSSFQVPAKSPRTCSGRHQCSESFQVHDIIALLAIQGKCSVVLFICTLLARSCSALSTIQFRLAASGTALTPLALRFIRSGTQLVQLFLSFHGSHEAGSRPSFSDIAARVYVSICIAISLAVCSWLPIATCKLHARGGLLE